jgi:hypothetical protein
MTFTAKAAKRQYDDPQASSDHSDNNREKPGCYDPSDSAATYRNGRQPDHQTDRQPEDE